MKGFTLIEVMIVVAMVAIVGLIVYGGFSSGSGNISFGINGLTETRCINGYKFVVGASGSAQQVLGANGGGVPCQ